MPDPVPQPSATPPSSSGRPPLPLVVAAALTFLEGVATVVLGLVEAFSLAGDRLVMGASTTVFFIVYGAALILCAWGIYTVRYWSRGPVLFAQLIQLGLAWNFREGDTWPVAVVLAVLGVLVLAGLLHPRSLAALNRDELS